MVYIDVWDEYQKAVEELYLAGPLKTRYVSKYRHSEGKLVLKVFDGSTCLKYRTDKLPDLKKFERLNLSLLGKMQCNKRALEKEGTETDLKGQAASPADNTPIQSPPPPTSRKGKKRRN
ncbi:signal recognition particle, SRP9/SRP14 subunit [Powellomyces hirtus]|nr:signal recognition particle, SRP9/SRP14 subunit [Powellomyces hirtus]